MRLIDADNCPCGTCGVRRCVIPSYRCADFMAWYNRTIDPESLRPRGRWEKHRTMHGFVYCSNCKDVYLDEEWLVDGKWGFCPNCGAKMEDEK